MTGLIRGRERVTLCRGIVKDAARQEWNNRRHQQGSPLRATQRDRPRNARQLGVDTENHLRENGITTFTALCSGIGYETRAN